MLLDSSDGVAAGDTGAMLSETWLRRLYRRDIIAVENGGRRAFLPE
jgi:hypothetical protein